MLKNLVENPNDSKDISTFCPNFTPAPIPRLATNKSIMKSNSILLCLFLLSNVDYFEDKISGHTIQTTRRFPDKRSTLHLIEENTLNLILQLFMHKDELIVRTTLSVSVSLFQDPTIIKKVAEINTFWERVIHAGLREGMGLRAATLLCSLIKSMIEEPEYFSKELKDLHRLFPDFVITWMSRKKPEQCVFLFEFEEMVNAEMYWTKPMHDELKNTVSLLFTLDLQNMEDYITGKKKVFPKPRSPPIKVEVFYTIPQDLLTVDGLFLSYLVAEEKQYDFKDPDVIRDKLRETSIQLIKSKLELKEMQSYDSLVVSDLRILSRVCLRLAQVKRIKNIEDYNSLLESLSIIVEHWSRNNTKILVRGVQIFTNLCQAMIDLLRIASIHIECKYFNDESLKKSFDIVGKVIKRIVKKYSIDFRKTSVIDFEIFSAALRLEHRIICLNNQDIIEGYQEMMSDPNQDFDFHLVYGLKIIRDNLKLIKSGEIENYDTLAGKKTQNPAPVQNGVNHQEEKTRAYFGSKITSDLEEAINRDLFSFENVSRPRDFNILSMRFQAYVETEDEQLSRSVKKSILLFNFYLLDILRRLSEHPRILCGFVRNGIAYTIIEIVLASYLMKDDVKDARLKSYLLQYVSIMRKTLSAGNETTIIHYGEENCIVELNLRGNGVEKFSKSLEALEEDQRLLLTEFFRVVRKNLHMKLIQASIKGYGPFATESGVLRNSESFLDWFYKQTNVKDPQFIWNDEYVEEMVALFETQVNSILMTRKANYSYHLDDYKSDYLSTFTKVGDIFLETLIQSVDYPLQDPERVLKQVNFDHKTAFY